METSHLSNYIQELLLKLATGNAQEHSYRPALESLFRALDSSVQVVNEPSRSAFGSPDFAFYKGRLTLGYVETKDLIANLDQVEKSEQLKRYMGYPSLILTNYLEFRFFTNGIKTTSISIAKPKGTVITPIPENYSILERELKAFLDSKPETITNAERLAEIMGGKAARVRDNVTLYLKRDDDRNHELLKIYKIMQDLLIKDLTFEKFADMYAQTLVYGLFIARYYDQSPEDFTRQEARDLIPASNPFLQHFFDHIAGPSFDKRLTFIVNELCDVFSVSSVAEIVTQHYNLFGETVDKDPVIHFYEDFLKEYDPQLRKNMGAYYTPVPVVQFIINAVDDILKKEFKLFQGLADTTRITHEVTLQGTKAKQNIHKIQILDPAVGTATFLNETVKFIHQKFKRQEGVWESYVEKELLPRLHGFELMMAPYTIAHLKLAMTFKETGIDKFDRRLGIYLTNTLEEGAKYVPDLFSLGIAEAISEEAKAASAIKHDTPIMIVIGNPPYSGESFNKGDYAMKLVEKYKYEPGGIEKLKERNPKWINDDYVKFLAFAEEMITKTGDGIVAMITNHGYIDNPTFRGMRWHLTKTFSSIYVLDLHGNAKKKEVSPDGGVDKNVFDIQQGVAIIIAVKHKNKREGLADVYKFDLWGNRKTKFDFLHGNTIDQIKWEKIRLQEPFYYFQNRNQKLEKEYNEGIKINELFPINNVGIVTSRDKFVIDENRNILAKRISNFVYGNIPDSELRQLVKESSKFNFDKAKSFGFDEKNISPIQYRPFDNRFIYYTNYYIERERREVMQHFIINDNIALCIGRQGQVTGSAPWNLVSLTKNMVDFNYYYRGGELVFPLYLYQNNQANLLSEYKRKLNLDNKLIKQLLINIGQYEWIDDHINKKPNDKDCISPLDLLDYVYASLYSPSYREKYKDFLKSDFPRVPIAKGKTSFWKLVDLGGKLRRLHLMEDQDLNNLITSYPIRGENLVEKVELRSERVFINDLQFFDDVPKEAWEFYIGGYQPAQKWLKDRKGKKLTYEDTNHYQKMIVALTETDKIMKQIDQINL